MKTVVAATIWSEGDRPLRINEAADQVGVSDKTIRRLITDGKLPSIKVRGLRFVFASQLRALFNAGLSGALS